MSYDVIASGIINSCRQAKAPYHKKTVPLCCIAEKCQIHVCISAFASELLCRSKTWSLTLVLTKDKASQCLPYGCR